MRKKYLLLFLFVLFASSAFSQISKTHYIPPITYANSGGATPTDQWIYISTPSVNDVIVDITEIGGGTTQVIINNSTSYPHPVSSSSPSQLAVNRNTVGQVITNRGYIISADCPIYVSVRYNVTNQGTVSVFTVGSNNLKYPSCKANPLASTASTALITSW